MGNFMFVALITILCGSNEQKSILLNQNRLSEKQTREFGIHIAIIKKKYSSSKNIFILSPTMLITHNQRISS